MQNSHSKLGYLLVEVLAGLVGGTAGFFVVGYIAASLCDWSTREADCVEPTIYPAITGGVVLMVVCMFLANRLITKRKG